MGARRHLVQDLTDKGGTDGAADPGFRGRPLR